MEVTEQEPASVCKHCTHCRQACNWSDVEEPGYWAWCNLEPTVVFTDPVSGSTKRRRGAGFKRLRERNADGQCPDFIDLRPAREAYEKREAIGCYSLLAWAIAVLACLLYLAT